MKKIVKEQIPSLINEAKMTRSYEAPLSREDVRALIGKVLIKFQKEGGRIINNMHKWLLINNFGDYQYNMWIKAIVDTMFKYTGGVWLPINQNLSIDQLTDKVMSFWHKKLSK